MTGTAKSRGRATPGEPTSVGHPGPTSRDRAQDTRSASGPPPQTPQQGSPRAHRPETQAINHARSQWAAEGSPFPTGPRTLTSELGFTSRLRTAAFHFRQEPPSNLRATHFRALTGRGTPTGNERPAEMSGWRSAGEEVRPPCS